ncbi:hypothetical protein [Flavobacterium succinicans]|uniref:hypothetical protein n=1 Tax=Flavobacterium succinicans TaxID=29536 RepID=UPI000B2A9F70|nr:hypothetical protein [Flavobacterium succinicans]
MFEKIVGTGRDLPLLFFFSPDRNGNPGVPKTSGSCGCRATSGSSFKRIRTTVFWNEEL